MNAVAVGARKINQARLNWQLIESESALLVASGRGNGYKAAGVADTQDNLSANEYVLSVRTINHDSGDYPVGLACSCRR
jgi:hypothetical protein